MNAILVYLIKHRWAAGVIAAALTVFGTSGLSYMKGREHGVARCLKSQIKTQTERAKDAEAQRDIANGVPASLDDVLDWLSQDGRSD